MISKSHIYETWCKIISKLFIKSTKIGIISSDVSVVFSHSSHMRDLTRVYLTFIDGGVYMTISQVYNIQISVTFETLTSECLEPYRGEILVLLGIIKFLQVVHRFGKWPEELCPRNRVNENNHHTHFTFRFLKISTHLIIRAIFVLWIILLIRKILLLNIYLYFWLHPVAKIHSIIRLELTPFLIKLNIFEYEFLDPIQIIIQIVASNHLIFLHSEVFKLWISIDLVFVSIGII